MMTENQFYSVLLPVYHKDLPEYIKIAIDSMLAQTLPPEEIVIAIDGPIGESLASVIHEYQLKHGGLFSVYQYDVNEGLGRLLNKTLSLCRNEYIARMDADDYSVPERMEKQFLLFRQHPEIDILGSNVNEFMKSIRKPVARVVLPEQPKDVLRFAKKRCPIRHPTLLYKKTDILNVGNYRDVFLMEDYDLIVRLLHGGYKIYNIQEPLVFMRIGKDFYKRRGGIRYLRGVFVAKKSFLVMGFFSIKDFLISFGCQAIIILMPGWFRELFYKKFLRH